MSIPKGRPGQDPGRRVVGDRQVDGTDAPVWGYRPHLDGLRAVAVYLVVISHAGVNRLAGGFIGVDVFFVLSGYLVTHILLGDLDSSGRVGFARFYSRRVRRLLPAAAVNLLVTAMVFTAVAAPAELAAARASIQAAALYVANWHFIGRSADYFGADIQASPVTHYWSLSVEEQFYLAWPLVLAGLYRATRFAGRSHRTLLRWVIALSAAASLVAALAMATTNLNRAYYGTDTRAYELLAGASLALAPGLVASVRRWARQPAILAGLSLATLGGLVVAATSVVSVAPVTRGVMATGLTCTLIVTLEAAQGGAGRAVLSAGALVFLGRISYGIYLWHWIVILVVSREADLTPLATLAVAVPVATGLAALSYELLERPIRMAVPLDRRRIAVIACGLAASAVVGLLIVPRLLDRATGSPSVAASSAPTDGTPVRVNWAAAFYDFRPMWICTMDNLRACTVVDGKGPTVMITGDSHANMLIPMLTKWARRHELHLVAAINPRCPWERGLRDFSSGPQCFALQAETQDRLIPALDPDFVLLAHAPLNDERHPVLLIDERAGNLPQGEPRRRTVQHQRSKAVVDALRADGREVVIIEPTPAAPMEENPLTCLSKARFLEECRYVTSTRPGVDEAIARELDGADDKVWSVDLDRAVCPYLPICDPVVHGLVVKQDDTHLTARFGVSLLDQFDRILVDDGVLER